jgi:hypothetical protein
MTSIRESRSESPRLRAPVLATASPTRPSGRHSDVNASSCGGGRLDLTLQSSSEKGHHRPDRQRANHFHTALYMARGLLRELHPRGQSQLGVDVGEMGLHGARGDEQPRGDVLVAQALSDESHDVELGTG